MEQKKQKRRVEKTEGHAKAWLSFLRKKPLITTLVARTVERFSLIE